MGDIGVKTGSIGSNNSAQVTTGDIGVKTGPIASNNSATVNTSAPDAMTGSPTVAPSSGSTSGSASASSSTSLSWASVSPGFEVRDAHFTDFYKGWVLSEDGKSIKQTQDGGQTWMNLSPLPQTGYSIFSTDDRTAWAGGIDAIYFTNDGGSNWSKISLPYSSLVKGVVFWDELSGCAVTGGFLTTVDGGKSWSKSAEGLGAVHGIAALDRRTVFIYKTANPLRYVAGFFKSGGYTGIAQQLDAIGAVPDESKRLVGTLSSQLFESPDYGLSWHETRYTIDGSPGTEQWQGVAAVASDRILGVSGRRVVASMDRGSTWTTVATISYEAAGRGDAYWYLRFFAFDSNHAWRLHGPRLLRIGSIEK